MAYEKGIGKLESQEVDESEPTSEVVLYCTELLKNYQAHKVYIVRKLMVLYHHLSCWFHASDGFEKAYLNRVFKDVG